MKTFYIIILGLLYQYAVGQCTEISFKSADSINYVESFKIDNNSNVFIKIKDTYDKSILEKLFIKTSDMPLWQTVNLVENNIKIPINSKKNTNVTISNKQDQILFDFNIQLDSTAETQKRNSFTYLIIGFVGGIMLTIIFMFIVKNIKPNKEVDIYLMPEYIDLKRRNIELEQANETKNRFFSIIAHDLKSPLNALIGFSDLLLEKFSQLSEEKRLKFITVVNNTSKLMYDMLVNLLDWARSQSGEIRYEPNNFRLIKLIRIAKEYNQYNAIRKRIEINIDIDEQIQVFVDYNMIMTILRNLLSNAIKFTEEGGKIELYINEELNGKLKLAIQDNGIGMSAEQKTKIFDKGEFASTLGTNNEQGTGIGLVLCNEFAKKLGGSLTVDSEEGKGSIFYLILPVY